MLADLMTIINCLQLNVNFYIKALQCASKGSSTEYKIKLNPLAYSLRIEDGKLPLIPLS